MMGTILERILVLAILIFCVNAILPYDVNKKVVDLPLKITLEITKPEETLDGEIDQPLETNKYERPLYCYLNAERGRCLSYIINYYYDRASNTCKTFVYSGCHGNQNRFETHEQCMRVCYSAKNV